MSNDQSTNDKKNKKRKPSIHVNLGRTVKTKLITECENIVRNPGQQIEFILKVYYKNRENPEFHYFFNEIIALQEPPDNVDHGDTA